MPTFDIVSKYNVQEVENTINMVVRDIANRYDFKGSETSINFNKKDKFIKIEANSEMHLDSVKDMLEKRAVGRSLSLKIFKYNEFEKASGMQVKQKIDLQEGISHDNAKIVNKLIKDSKLKVQSQIQGDQIRVSGKKIDDLQSVIELLKNKNLNFSLQFINMKK
ncbi:MAG: YajQ family cyclic di-GMP-binding protein [Euryarchaeota archaeon]|nr:YajQ family cyclic di-GMP-binding protein [Euryarchaeota archaeon]|tara:strand:- start:76 stop:567 length:492 start_codon:yes stop_codon:yes gene_type:complete